VWDEWEGPWSLHDRTGGDLDLLLERIREAYTDVRVERLTGTHPADDDNVYWINRGPIEVQIDTAPDGAPPFVVESDFPDLVWRHAVHELVRELG